MTLRQYSHWILRTLGSPSMKYSIRVSWFSRSHCSVVIGILLWLLRIYGGYQNGNHHFYTIKRYDCLVGDQNDHQLNLLCYGWVVICGFRNPALFTVAWHNVKSRSSVTHKVDLVNDALCHSPDQLAILTSWYWGCRSPCVDFLPPSSGVFRLSHLGVIAGYPMQTVMRFSRSSARFGNKKSPHNNLNLTIPSGMALVRVRYVAIRKSKTCSGSFRSRAGTLGKYVILNCWDRLPQKSSRVNKKFWKYATFGRVQENTRETLAKRERAGRCQPSWHDSRKTQKDFRNFEL